MKKNKPVVGLTLGDINGIGSELIIRTFEDERMLSVCTPVIYGSSKTILYYRKMLQAQNFNFQVINSAKEHLKADKINLINVWPEEVQLNVGTSTPDGGKYALQSLKAAVADLKSGGIDCIVTAPINKANIQSPEFEFPGHTEYLQKEFNTNDVLMLMVSGKLKVGMATGHLPLSKVSEKLSIELIQSKINLINTVLQTDFNIIRPRIAVLGLNPHAGDEGLLGAEENEIIIPAIKATFNSGVLAFGPYAADGFFGSPNFLKYDAVLAMYHDQGLTPFKALAFEDGVNYTGGLSIIRTSPDHGTAYDLAGKGIANINSFREAIYTAVNSFETRSDNKELKKNAIKPAKTKLTEGVDEVVKGL